jgi:hypothetical protein
MAVGADLKHPDSASTSHPLFLKIVMQPPGTIPYRASYRRLSFYDETRNSSILAMVSHVFGVPQPKDWKIFPRSGSCPVGCEAVYARRTLLKH